MKIIYAITDFKNEPVFLFESKFDAENFLPELDGDSFSVEEYKLYLEDEKPKKDYTLPLSNKIRWYYK